VLALLSVSACIPPVKIAVNPVVSPAAPLYETPCADPAGAVACLSDNRPHHRLQLANEEILWARISSDGRTIVASTVPAVAVKPHLQRVSFVAFDTADRKELWRMRLAPNARIGAEDIHFVGNDRIALLTDAGLFQWGNTLLVVDAHTGAEVWRTPGVTEKAGEFVQMLLYDAERQYFVVGSSTIRILDANTGAVLATRQNIHQAPGVMKQAFSSGSMKNPRVTGGLPFMTDRDLYLYNFGLVRLSRDDKKFLWGQRFTTFAEDDYTGANVGRAIAGALLGVNTGNIPPDFMVGRTSEPAIAGGKIVTGALGFVHCIEYESGKLLWTQDLAVPQVARVAVRGDRAYVLAGGTYVFWHGRQGMSIRNPIRSGLYALNLSDGSPVSGFASPFNPNNVARGLTQTQVDDYNEDDAYESEEDWGDIKKGAAATKAPASAPAPAGSFTKNLLIGLELLTDRGMLVASDDAVIHLDDSGAEIRRYPLEDLGAAINIARAGDHVVVRTRNGVVVFDAANGAKVWQKKDNPAGTLSVLPDAGSVPLIRTIPWQPFRDAEAKHFGSQLFWLLPEEHAVVVAAGGTQVGALRIDNGETIWQLDAPGRIAIGNGWITQVNGDTAQLYRLPRM
jgi:outer membrane protein assembly factor BamB